MRITVPVVLAVGMIFGARVDAAKKLAKADVATQSPLAAAQTTTDLAAKTRPAVVMITTRNADGGPGGVGTGFFIGTNGLIATSLHVIGEGRPVAVRLADGTSVPVISIYAWDRHADIAVLKMGGTQPASLPLYLDGEVKQGTEAVAMGHPLGLTQSVVEGVVSARREIDGVELLQLAMPVEPGNSGGPVIDRQGRVLGIINSKATLTQNLGFATSVRLLSGLLAHPNGTTLEHWLHYNSIDTNDWRSVFGADWHSHGGSIEVESPGDGFGGRALLLRRTAPPVGPYEISVEVRLDDESGAAGLVFDSDGGARHYGFYPTGGRLRATAFGGPDVNSWRILTTTDCAAYRPGEWNRVQVRVLENGFQGYVNEELVFSGHERVFGHGLAGLAKFRNTAASFRSYQVRPLATNELAESRTRSAPTATENAKTWLNENPDASRPELLRRAREFERLAAEFRQAADRSHQAEVLVRLKDELAKPEPEIDLMNAAIWLARYDQPTLDVAMCQRRFVSLVAEAKSQLAEGDSPTQKVEKIRRFLFEESGFHGNRFDYYNLANCHLNSVLDEREGIPVTLAVLYLDLCWKLGVSEVSGLPVPGHFMVRFSPADAEASVIDVFDQGHKLTFEEADKLIAGDTDLEPHSATAKSATKREMLLRIVSNLRQFTQQQRGPRESLPYADLLVELGGEERSAVASRLDRVGLLLELGEKSRAKSDLRWIVDHRPAGVDLERIEEALRQMDERE